MTKPGKWFDSVAIAFFVVAGSWFLLRLAYLPIWISSPAGLALLLAFRFFLRARYGVSAPLWIVLTLLAAIEVDAIGNYFGWYNRRFELVQYDEIAHCLVSALVIPAIVWLLKARFDVKAYKLPVGWIAFFAFTTVFTLAGFYEVIELWDDKYMHPEPGMRIHGAYDTANDLQWDLLGMGIGAIASYFAMRRRADSGVNTV
ncbi:MAG: DUF2238 domain-containing protein [Acidobacteria bacterium]|nr:DUF2238 domain-containing protein [Acidobacteriota bacterium]MCW5967391.1 DUF2238 domain-containing protein [Blastocatellales bacterium]